MTAGSDWERVARQLQAEALVDSLHSTTRQVETVASRLEAGAALTHDDLRGLRTTITDLQVTVEERIVPPRRTEEPYERAADHIPADRLREVLRAIEDEDPS